MKINEGRETKRTKKSMGRKEKEGKYVERKNDYLFKFMLYFPEVK